jgi:hypothetical protein
MHGWITESCSRLPPDGSDCVSSYATRNPVTSDREPVREMELAILVLIRVIKELSPVPGISMKSACEILGRLMDHLR